LAPVLWFLARAPRQVWFNLVEYHALYRRANWSGATGNDIDVLSTPFQDTQWFILSALAVAGLVYMRRSRWDSAARAESSLCVWLALAIGAQNATAHPTFEQYFIFLVPFLAVPACAGAYAAASRLQISARPGRVVWAIGIFMTAALARGVFEERDDVTWSRLAPAARKVAEVAPPGAAIVAREQIYLLAHRLPPAGLESIYSTKLDLGARENALFHILPSAERDRRIKAAGFAATVVCDDDERADEVDGWDVYSEKAELGTCTVFWKPKPAGELSQ
jgi:4-amino-4-deoxy-L-arabinose transferase-like glycosyltransferase